MKTILVSGGAGYIGSHVAKEFARSGYKVLVLDNLSLGHEDFIKWGDFFKGDIGDLALLETIFTEHSIDAVSHFAAFASVAESVKYPEKYYENNVIKAKVLADFASKAGVKVFQFSSTCNVYGEPEEIPISETHPKKPLNPYGNSKLQFENILIELKQKANMDYSILRYFNASGASRDGEIGEDHRPETHLIPLILDVALKKREEVLIYGDKYNTPDGTCIRDYIHVEDLAKAHVLVLENALNKKISTVYNLGSEKGYSVKEVIDACELVTGSKIKKQVAPPRGGDSTKLIGSCEKIKKELFWEPEYKTIESIVDTAWNWHKKRFI